MILFAAGWLFLAQGRSFSSMDRSKKKFSGTREASKKGPALGWVIVLAAVGGAVIGSAATYLISKPQPAPKQSATPLLGEIPQTQAVAVPPLQQFTPAPQPPGEAPPGKVWSVEHGHWHDAPVELTTPVPATETPAPATLPAENNQ